MAIPVPTRQSGFTLGDPGAPLRLDVFLDIQCPYSAKAWPTLMALCDAYPNAELSVTSHLMIIANHRQAWDVSRLVHAVCDRDPQRFRAFATFLFERQESYFNGAFADRTHADLLAHCDHLARAFDPDLKEIVSRMDSDRVATLVRTPIRNAALRGVWATPTFFLNDGELVALGSGSDLSDWRDVLDPILAQD